MKDRFDIDQVIRILGLNIRADQADGGADFDVACNIARKKLWKVKEYEGLEEQGKLLKLPCAVGDNYYRIDDGTYPNELEFINIQQIISVMDKIGRTVFFTKEQAEAALQKMNETEE